MSARTENAPNAGPSLSRKDNREVDIGWWKTNISGENNGEGQYKSKYDARQCEHNHRQGIDTFVCVFQFLHFFFFPKRIIDRKKHTKEKKRSLIFQTFPEPVQIVLFRLDLALDMCSHFVVRQCSPPQVDNGSDHN